MIPISRESMDTLNSIHPKSIQLAHGPLHVSDSKNFPYIYFFRKLFIYYIFGQKIIYLSYNIKSMAKRKPKHIIS